ncbi:MAG: asparagine synthase (glutamine-hydrolyzing) [Candidatus Krumholzibacteriia bacterium]
MCGIAGVLNHDGTPVDRDLLTTMCDVIAHRGPDDAGVFADGPVGLGNRRLSIIDLEGGHQPICNAAGTACIVYNGELYNYRELRSELEAAGCRFQTQSDTEVVLESYEAWGVDCVMRFNGIFALAVWDAPRRRLFLARDHLGVKPLYFYQDQATTVFASEIKSILEHPRVPRTVDLHALDMFLTYRYVPSPGTLLEGIRKLSPGHRLVLENGGTRVESFWDYAPEIDRRVTEDEAADRLAALFEQAVRRQMVSDVPVGLMLSGGVDSGAVLAVMRKYAGEAVKTFTVGFEEDSDANELAEARETAGLFGAEHHEVVVSAVEYRDFLPRALWHLEEPLSTTSILPFYYVSELARRHVKVVLTGQGADEPFAGYNRYRGEKLGGYLRRFPARIQQGLSRASLKIPHRGEGIRRAARALTVEDPVSRFVEVYAVFSASERRGLYRAGVAEVLAGHDPSAPIARLQERVSHLDSLAQMLYIDTRVWLADDLLLYGDKLSMAHSLEARVPFLDVEFLEYAETLPSDMKLRGLTGKYIHKKAMSRWLPPQIIRRKKKGFATPMDRWLRGELTDYLRDTLLATGTECHQYFDRRAIAGMIDEHSAGARDYQRQLFALLTFELWHRIFVGAGER